LRSSAAQPATKARVSKRNSTNTAKNKISTALPKFAGRRKLRLEQIKRTRGKTREIFGVPP
jgi:hypothetical protein